MYRCPAPPCLAARYAGIIAEDLLGFNKAGVALGTAVSLWIIRSTGAGDAMAGAEAELAASLTQVRAECAAAKQRQPHAAAALALFVQPGTSSSVGACVVSQPLS